MLEKLLSLLKLDKNSIKRVYVGLILVTIISKILGFAREAVIAYEFGVDVDLDIFLVALTIPNMIYSILLYAVPNIIVPKYMAYDSDEVLFRNFSSSFFWPYVTIISILEVVYVIFSGAIIKIIAGDLSPEHLSLAVELSRYFSIFIYFSSLYCAFKGIFHVKKWFLIPAIAPFFIHLFVILSALFLSSKIGVRSIVLGMGIGAFFSTSLMVIILNKRNLIKYFKVGYILSKEYFSPFIIIILIEILGQTYTLVDRSFTAEIPTGFISGLNYANILNMLPVSILGITLSTVLFPDFSKLISEKNYFVLFRSFNNSIKYSLIVGSLSMVVIFFGSDIIVKLLLQRGEFNENATFITSNFLKYASIGIPLIMMHTIMAKLYLSLGYEKLLLAITLTSVIIKIGFNTIFISVNWYWGIALSTVIAFAVNVLLLFAILIIRKKNFRYDV